MHVIRALLGCMHAHLHTAPLPLLGVQHQDVAVADACDWVLQQYGQNWSMAPVCTLYSHIQQGWHLPGPRTCTPCPRWLSLWRLLAAH
jgi:hypothetical protein